MSRYVDPRTLAVAALFLFVSRCGAFTLIELTAVQARVSDPASHDYFFQGFTNPTGTVGGQIMRTPDLHGGFNGFNVLLPAVQRSTNDVYSMVGLLGDGSVFVACDGSVARGIIAVKTFEQTFGVPESRVAAELLAGDTNLLIGLLEKADTAGLLPAVQPANTPSAGQLISFSVGRAFGNLSARFDALLGDANGDGKVNFSDFNVLARNFGKTNVGFDRGDFNGDGVVNFADFTILANHFDQPLTGVQAAQVASFGQSMSSPNERSAVEEFAAQFGSVPEPSLGTLGTGALLLLWRVRRA